MLLCNENLVPIQVPMLLFLSKVMRINSHDARNAVLIVIGLAGSGRLSAAQLMHGTILSLREQTFVETARSSAQRTFGSSLAYDPECHGFHYRECFA